MGATSWPGVAGRCAAAVLLVGLAGGCAPSDGRTVTPSDPNEPPGAAEPDPDTMAVDEYCAMYPSEVGGVGAEATAEGVVVTWHDSGPGSAHEIFRRSAGSDEWVPLARLERASALRYVDTVPRFGDTVEYQVVNDVACEDESGANTGTLVWDDDAAGARPGYCEVWASPITDVTAQVVDGGLVEVTWRDTEDPPPGTAYLIHARAPGARGWRHEDSWVAYRAADDLAPPSFLVPLRDDPALGVGATFGVSRAAVCDAETLDGATAEVTDPGAT